MLCVLFNTTYRRNAKQHESPRVGNVGNAFWVTEMVPTCARNPANDAKQHEFPVFGDGCTAALRGIFYCVVQTWSETQRNHSVLAMLVDSGAVLVATWRPKKHCQHAPTPENLNVFGDVVE